MRYVEIPAAAVDTQLLEDATRRGQLQNTLTRVYWNSLLAEAANQAKNTK